MKVSVVVLLSVAAAASALQPQMPLDVASNEIQRQMAADSLLSDIMNQCFQSLNLESMTCMRVRVLMYMNQLLGQFQFFKPLSQFLNLESRPYNKFLFYSSIFLSFLTIFYKPKIDYFVFISTQLAA